MIWAIGDIHGCLRELESLIELIDPTENDKFIFTGDYIDRGPDSKGVVDFLIDLSKRTNCIFLRGNHEAMLLDTVYNNANIDLWIYNGAHATWRSYGSLEELKLNTEHLKFYSETKFYHVEGNYLFVHGGVRPNIELEKQDPLDIVWIREEFILRKHNLPYIIVFGHTPVEDVLFLDDKIGIDTGCVYGGKLCAVNLTEFIENYPEKPSALIEKFEKEKIIRQVRKYGDD